VVGGSRVRARERIANDSDVGRARPSVSVRNRRSGAEVADQVTNPAVRDRYIINSLIEESITSSQLEGAATTMRVAKEMLRSGRVPRTTGERMIVNNYNAMTFVRELVGKPITPKLVFDIHRIVTQDSLPEPSAAGRLRKSDERVVVTDEQGVTIHTPPPARLLQRRLERMCAFANDPGGEPFLHPLPRAVILHFWVGYDLRSSPGTVGRHVLSSTGRCSTVAIG
jgi:Fic family protein